MTNACIIYRSMERDSNDGKRPKKNHPQKMEFYGFQYETLWVLEKGTCNNKPQFKNIVLDTHEMLNWLNHREEKRLLQKKVTPEIVLFTYGYCSRLLLQSLNQISDAHTSVWNQQKKPSKTENHKEHSRLPEPRAISNFRGFRFAANFLTLLW